jgi:hypothetical protein
MKKFFVFIVAISFLLFPVKSNATENCPTYSLSSLFYEDYYHGTKWNIKEISWSANSLQIDGTSVVRKFSDDEINLIRIGIKSWDDTLDSISFKEVNSLANINIGLIALNSRFAGYWYANWDTNLSRHSGYIKINPNSTFFKSKDGFIHTIQHEIGNILGLGDIKPNEKIVSVLEDPFQDFYGDPVLGDFDTGLIRQLYGESTCSSSFLKNKNNRKEITITNSTDNSINDNPTIVVKNIKPSIAKEKYAIACKNNKKTITIYRYNKDYPCPKGYYKV